MIRDAYSHAQPPVAVETHGDLLCRFLPDSTLTFVNDAYCRYWNRTREQLLGTKFVELIPESAREAVMARIGRLREGIDRHEHQVRLPDGTIGWQCWVNRAIVDAHGHLVEFEGIGYQITEQRSAEEAVGRAEARTAAILRAIPDLMFVLRRDGTYVDYHARDAARLFLPPHDFIGRNVRDIMPASLADVMAGAIERAHQSDEPVVIEYELPMGGEQRWFEARITPADDDHVLTIVRDVTETRHSQELTRNLARQLIAGQEMDRRRIALELHDDISQRLAMINMELDEIAARVGEEPLGARLRSVSDRTREVAGDIHTLSFELHPQKLQVLGLVSAMSSLCREVSGTHAVHVRFAHDAVPAGLELDVSLCIYRIVQEALHNILRHSGAREARVDVSCVVNEIRLRVTDSGIGFDRAAMPSAGLGLASMQARVAALNGQFTLEAAPGIGTRIDVRIPLGAEQRT